MTTSEIPSELLSLVYATASDSSHWQSFCDELNTVTTVPIMMYGHNLGANESFGLLASGLDPVEIDRYQSHYADKNPWMHMNAVMPTGTVGISDQALRREELFKTEFYNDWLRQQEDVVAGPFMMCHRTPKTIVGLAAACRARGVNETLPNNQALFEALAPHLARAITMSSALSHKGSTSFALLEASRYAIIILRRSGKVGFINNNAQKLVSGEFGLTINHLEQLVSAHESLKTFLDQAGEAMSKNALLNLPEPITMRTEKFGACVFHAHIFPADADHKFPCSAWHDPVAGAIVITDARGTAPQETYAQLARSMGATAAEARLAQGVVDGLTLYEYADAHALSRHTVRNQMRVLLQKTQTRNQADFIRLLHVLSSPFTSPAM